MAQHPIDRNKEHHRLFNVIAPVYGLFYTMQKKRFATVIRNARHRFDLNAFESILDVGCGTGALCAVLSSNGRKVTGVEPAKRMLAIARGKPENRDVAFHCADILAGLPFEDDSFDLSIASYVAHGLHREERERMYAEMSRVTRHGVIIYDYNKRHSILTTIVEWLERGDYFHFIRHAETEMIDCVDEMRPCFSSVTVFDVDTRAAWYICTPSKQQ
jgi:SAM-dependent methyltransferase